MNRVLKAVYQFFFGWIYWIAYISGGNFIRRAFISDCAQNVKIAPTAFLKFPHRIRIGANSFINHNCCIWAAENGSITLGKDVILGPGVCLIASNHGIEAGTLIRQQEGVDAPIIIGNDVWLGANVVVTAGITIGDGCVVGAGAVVTKDLPPNAVCVGIPARVIRYRDGSKERNAF